MNKLFNHSPCRILCGLLCTTAKECQLYQIKGKKSPKCIEQETITWNSFRSAYVMILKSPTCLFIWIGHSSSLSEKRNGLTIANMMREEYQLFDLVIVDDGYEQSMNEMHRYEWNRCLTLKNRCAHRPALIDQKPEFSLKLFKCGYHEGKYRIEEHTSKPPQQGDLSDPEAVYIIDGAPLGVWIWTGKFAGQIEKNEAMRNARGFVKKKKYPSSTPVIKVSQECEPIEFLRLFPAWTTVESVKKTKTFSNLDSLTLFQRPKQAADIQLIDDGTGEKHIFRITDGRYNELLNQTNSVFFSNDCYLIHYITVFTEVNSVNNNNAGVRLVVYFWIGDAISSEIRKKCETSAKNYFENLDKHTMIVKLKQGFETPHFLQMFGGKFIVFNQQNNVSIHSDINAKIPNKFILKIYGNSTYTSKAFEVDSMAMNCCQDRFIVKAENLWIWYGQGSTGDAREVAKTIGATFGECTIVIESKEPEEFLKSVTIEFKQQNACNDHIINNDILTKKMEIYDKSRVSLYVSFQIQENSYTQDIVSFDQSDLAPEDIYFLDAGAIIFVWIGSLSNKGDRKTCWQNVKQFLRNHPVPRNENTTVAIIQQSGEPNVFTGFFDSWDNRFWSDHITYEQMRKFIQKSMLNTNNVVSIINGENDFDKYQKYPIPVLQQEVDLLPQGVNPIRKEIHLTHDDFVGLFNMQFSEFNALPIWKKQELKKKHKLF